MGGFRFEECRVVGDGWLGGSLESCWILENKRSPRQMRADSLYVCEVLADQIVLGAYIGILAYWHIGRYWQLTFL